MKTAKKLLALVLRLCMICSIVACGNAPAAEEPKATEAPAQTQAAPQEAPAAEENTDGYQVNQELLASEGTTLTLYGPGVFTETGADGSIDLISGVEKIGYNVLIERWNELYPNCELVIEATSWCHHGRFERRPDSLLREGPRVCFQDLPGCIPSDH